MTKTIKTNLHGIFATDRDAEEEGVWIGINDFQGLKIKVRRMRSDAASKAFEAKVNEKYGEGKFRELAQKTDNAGEDLLILQLSCVLIDWKGLIDTEAEVEDGEPLPEIPYSEELALELLHIRDFREFVFQAASNRDQFREKSDEDGVKN